MTLTCHHCHALFDGRPNRVYCSTSCKSATNNERYARRDYQARKVERAIRKNRGIVSKLYQLFDGQALSARVIEQTALNTAFNTGAAADGSLFCFLDFALQRLPSNHYQIIKTV